MSSITRLPPPDRVGDRDVPPRPRVFTLRRLVISFLLASSVVGIVYAFISSEDQQAPKVLKSAVLRVYPPEGAFQLRQEIIGVQLDQPYTGVLLIDGVEIPLDQLRYVDGTNEITYTPGEGTETGLLEPGTHRATVVFWPKRESRETAPDRYSWTFKVH